MPIGLLHLFLAILPFRLINAFTTKTFFQPDEFFQALEPAHKMVYGFGYTTWEWKEALRSSIHPLIYVVAYKIGNLLLPEETCVWIVPKVVGAVVAATGETFLYKFALRYSKSPQVAALSVIFSLTSSWNWFFITRSFSNNLEMVLTTVGLAYWPWREDESGVFSCIFGFLSCIVRPTNALLWGFMGITLVWRTRDLAKLFLSLSLLLAFVLGYSAVVDHYFYGRWTFPLWNFVEFNVFRNLLIFYGAAPWHFYLFQGLPLMLMGFLPLLLWSLWKFRRTALVRMCLFVVVGFSCLSHKEFRFIYPLYPVFMVVAALGGRNIMQHKKLLVAVVVFHASVAFFFTQINEAGEIRVIEYLRDTPQVTQVGFLTPCHSTPWHSMLHRRDLESSWFLTCEPPLHLARGNLQNVREYRDELDRFFDDPAEFLSAQFPPPGTTDDRFEKKWPSHLVFFEPMESTVADYVGENYRECARFFNSYFHWDSRRSGDIIVLENVPGSMLS